MSEPLVSIIVPCYNYAHYMPETLEQLLRQSYSNWECIMVDDGSKDNTAEVAKGFEQRDSRFRYVYQKNQGLSAARNTGVIRSKGKYIQLLDADDLIHEDKLRLQVSILEQDASTDIVYGDALYFDSDTPDKKLKGRGREQNKHQHLKKSGKGKEMLSQICVDNFIVVSSPLVRKSMFDKVGKFDTSYTSYEDWQYWFRAALQGAAFKYAPVEGTETYIRIGHVSMMANKKKMVENGIRIRQFMNEHLESTQKHYNNYRLLKLKLRRLLGI